VKKRNNYTILIQGKIDRGMMNLWLKNYKDYHVVLSVWEDEDLSQYQIPNNWKIVINQYPLIRFRKEANLDYQIITTLKGIEYVKTNWVIKVRADEYYSNLDIVYDRIVKFPNKIVTSSVFFRKWGMYKFHCSDKLIAGTVDNVRLMFESTLLNIQLNLWEYPVPESQLGFGYVYAKEPTFDLELLEVKRKTPFDESTAIQIINSGISKVAKGSVDILSENIKNPNLDWNDIIKELTIINDIVKECISEISYRDEKYLDRFSDKELMKKWFDIIDVNELKPYIITRNFGGNQGRVWYKDNFDHSENDCLTSINKN
jgi:hypothetical protein